jgi:hypothetical protein
VYLDRLRIQSLWNSKRYALGFYSHRFFYA